MKWIGQHIVDLIARFRSEVYLEDVSTGTIESGGNLGLDSNNKVVKATVSSGSGDITGVDLTAGAGITISDELNTGSGDYSATVGHSDTSSQSSVNNSGRAFIQDLTLDDFGHVTGITSATDADSQVGTVTSLTVQTDSGSGARYTSSTTPSIQILGATGVGVTNSSGVITATAVPSEIDHDSLSNFVAAEHVDWAGASAGTVHSTNIPTLNQDTSGEAGTVATIAGLAPNTATTQATQAAITTCANLVTVGTIGTGVWNATKILSAKTTQVMILPFKGFVTGIASGNFQYAEQFPDPNTPDQLNTDYGDTVIANGSLTDVSDFHRGGGTVMSRAVTAIKMYGWCTCGGTDDITISLCKVTPTPRALWTGGAAITPVVVATTTLPAINNDKMDLFDVTGSDAGTGTGSIVTSAIAAGDILMPFIISPNTKTTVFNLVLEVEF